jgi:hypothetical protein
VLDGFDERFRLAGQQVDTLDQRLVGTVSEYRQQDTSGSERVLQAGDGVEGVV